MIALLILLCLAALVWVTLPLWDREAAALNLEIDMAQLGQTLVARIAPTNAAGAPAPVFDIVWEEEGDSYSIVPAPDGLSATIVADAAGAGNVVVVHAVTRGGAILRETLALPDVDSPVDEEAVALNLSLDAAA